MISEDEMRSALLSNFTGSSNCAQAGNNPKKVMRIVVINSLFTMMIMIYAEIRLQ